MQRSKRGERKKKKGKPGGRWRRLIEGRINNEKGNGEEECGSARVSWRRPITLKHSREGVLQIKAVQLLGGEHQKLRGKNW